MTETGKRQFRLREAAVIMLAAVLAYLPALRAGFVFDDWTLLVQQPRVPATEMLRRIWLTTDAPDYYPVTWTSWLMQRQLWGAAPLGYHVVNILLHGLNAVLIAQVLRRLSVPGGWFAGLIFAVHPVNVASVAWVSEHKNILAMLFFILTVLAYLRFEDTDSPRQGTRPTTERGQWRWYAVSLVCFLLSLLAKPAAVMWPVVLLGLA